MPFNYNPQYNTPDGYVAYPGGLVTFNVKDYGAVGDGVTDDTSAFQSAFNAALENLPSRLLVPDGVYLLASTVGNINGKMQVPYLVDANISTDVLTFNTNHTKKTGEPIVFRGTVPAGMSIDTVYYVNAVSPTTMKLYDTAVNAIAGGSTGLVNITQTIKTTGNISNGSNSLSVTAALNAQVGTVALITGASSLQGNFVVTNVSGTTITLNLNNDSPNVIGGEVIFTGIIDVTYLNLGIVVEGTGRALLRKTGSGFSGQAIIDLRNTGNITVSNLAFEGYTFPLNNALVNNDNLLHVSSSQKVLVTNCNFKNCGDHALVFRTSPYDYIAKASLASSKQGVNASEYVITNNYFYNVHYVGNNPTNYVQGSVKNCYIAHNTFENLRGSIRLSNRVPGGENVVISNNTINTVLDKGFEIDGITNLIIQNNIINDATNYGIFLYANTGTNTVGFAFQNLKLYNNIINRPGINGIRIALDTYVDTTKFDGKNIEIVGNQISDMTGSTNVRAIFWVSGKPQGLRIANNTIQNFNGVSCIEINGRVDSSGFSNDIIVEGNIIQGVNNASGCNILYFARTSGTTDLLRNIIIRNNIITNCSALRVLYLNWVDGMVFEGNKVDVTSAVVFFGQDTLTNLIWRSNDIKTTGTGIILSATATINGVIINGNKLNVVGTGITVGNMSTQNIRIYENDITATVATINAPVAPIDTVPMGQTGRRELMTDAPTLGTWRQGDRIDFTNVTSSTAAIGKYCTVSGTLGTLTGGITGAINAGQTNLTVTASTNLAIGAYITIVGVNGVKKITAISSNTVTIDTPADNNVTVGGIAYSPPTFIDIFASGGTGGGGSSTPLTIQQNGISMGSQFTLNLIEGSNMTLTTTNDTTNNRINVTFAAATGGGVAGINVQNSGTLIGSRPTLNFVQGANQTLTIQDDAANNRVNITIASGITAGGGNALLNIKDFGATGNGTTNDGPSIQNAINSAFTQGKSGIFIPDGVYKITGNSQQFDIGGGTITYGLYLPFNLTSPSVSNYDPATGIITFDLVHRLVTGFPVVLLGPPPYGVVAGDINFARVVNTTQIQLYGTRSQANAGGSTGLISLTGLTVSSIDTGANSITVTTNHNLRSGDRVRIAASTAPGGVNLNSIYYANVVDNNTLRLYVADTDSSSSPPAFALAGGSTGLVDITSAGSGVTVRRVLSQLAPQTFSNGFIIEGTNRARLMKDPADFPKSYGVLYGRFFSNIAISNVDFWGVNPDWLAVGPSPGSGTYGGDNGLQLASCSNVHIDSCRFEFFSDSAIRFTSDHIENRSDVVSKELVVRNCYFYRFGQTSTTANNSVYQAAASNCKYINNTFEQSFLGMKFASRTVGSGQILIQGNTFKDCTDTHVSGAVITAQGYGEMQIKDNFFNNIGTNSSCRTMFLYNSPGTATDEIIRVRKLAITGNQLINCQRGIYIQNDAVGSGNYTMFDIQVKDNIITDMPANGGIPSVDAAAGAIYIFGSGGSINRVQVQGNILANIGYQHGFRMFMNGATSTATDSAIQVQGNIFQNFVNSSASCITLVPSSGSINGIQIQNNRSSTGTSFITLGASDDVMITGNAYKRPGGVFRSGSTPTRLIETQNQVITT